MTPDLDQIFLKKYENSVYKNIITNILNEYKKIFYILFNSFDQRFQKVFNTDLFVSIYYIKFLMLFEKEAEEIISYIKTNPLKTKDNKFQSVNDTVKKNYSLLNAKIFLVNNEGGFDKEVNARRIKSKGKILYLGMNKYEIKNKLNILLFDEADYFIRTAEHKKYIYDSFKKHYTDFISIYYVISDSKKIISKIEGIRKVKPDRKGESASGGDTFYQMYRKFSKTMKQQDLSSKKINEEILNNLKELK